MANTYTQIHIQAIFAVKKRAGLIQKERKDELYKYITGIIKRYDHRLLAVNGMPDHLHVFFGMRLIQSLSELMQDVKGSSSKWINEKNFSQKNLNGKKDMEHFPIVSPRLQELLLTSKIRRCIIKKLPFWKSTKGFLRNLRLTMMRDIFKAVE